MTFSDAGLKVSIEQCSVLRFRHDIVDHSSPVLSTVASVDLIQATDPFQTQDVLETLLEVVRQEGVEDRVGATVGVTQHHHEVKRAFQHGCCGNGSGHRGHVEYVKR